MGDVYSNKPRTQSDPNEWHELSFQISVDCPVDWDGVDLRKWSQAVAKYTALMMAESTEFAETQDTLKTLIMNVTVDRIKLVADSDLYKMMDEFDE